MQVIIIIKLYIYFNFIIMLMYNNLNKIRKINVPSKVRRGQRGVMLGT
jgi:hypothetical protein